MTMGRGKVVKELEVLHGFIDMVNSQIGVYMDCLTSFEGNKVRIERQMARVLRASGRRTDDDHSPVITYASLADPDRPDAIHHRIVRAKDFVASNAEAGFNEQQVCWSIIVFLFAYWDDEIRPQIAAIRGMSKDDIKVNALGDLRVLRNCIVHDKGIISAAKHAKLLTMSAIVAPDQRIAPSHDQMHTLFVLVKQAIAEMIMTYMGHLPGAPDPSDIKAIAIENHRRRL
jgi:hypothetical protein